MSVALLSISFSFFHVLHSCCRACLPSKSCGQLAHHCGVFCSSFHRRKLITLENFYCLLSLVFVSKTPTEENLSAHRAHCTSPPAPPPSTAPPTAVAAEAAGEQ